MRRVFNFRLRPCARGVCGASKNSPPWAFDPSLSQRGTPSTISLASAPFGCPRSLSDDGAATAGRGGAPRPPLRGRRGRGPDRPAHGTALAAADAAAHTAAQQPAFVAAQCQAQCPAQCQTFAATDSPTLEEALEAAHCATQLAAHEAANFRPNDESIAAFWTAHETTDGSAVAAADESTLEAAHAAADGSTLETAHVTAQ